MRPSKDQHYLAMAKLVSLRGTCKRRQVGCVLVNNKGHVLSTGYNGMPMGFNHCSGQDECPGAKLESGSGLDVCEAIHAEQNALLQCKDVFEIDTVFTTTSPCMHCIKLLLNTSAKRIVYINDYVNTRPRELWELSNRLWERQELHEDIGLRFVTNS